MDDLSRCEQLFREVGNQLDWFKYRPQDLLVKLAAQIREEQFRASSEELTDCPEADRAMLAMVDPPPTQSRRATTSRVRRSVDSAEIIESMSTLQICSTSAENDTSATPSQESADSENVKKKATKKTAPTEKPFSFFPSSGSTVCDNTRQKAAEESPITAVTSVTDASPPSRDVKYSHADGSHSTLPNKQLRFSGSGVDLVVDGSLSEHSGAMEQEAIEADDLSLAIECLSTDQDVSLSPSSTTSSPSERQDNQSMGAATPVSTGKWSRIQMADDSDDDVALCTSAFDDAHLKATAIPAPGPHHGRHRLMDSSTESSPVGVGSKRLASGSEPHRIVSDSSADNSPILSTKHNKSTSEQRHRRIVSESSDDEDSTAIADDRAVYDVNGMSAGLAVVPDASSAAGQCATAAMEKSFIGPAVTTSGSGIADGISDDAVHRSSPVEDAVGHSRPVEDAVRHSSPLEPETNTAFPLYTLPKAVTEGVAALSESPMCSSSLQARHQQPQVIADFELSLSDDDMGELDEGVADTSGPLASDSSNQLSTSAAEQSHNYEISSPGGGACDGSVLDFLDSECGDDDDHPISDDDDDKAYAVHDDSSDDAGDDSVVTMHTAGLGQHNVSALLQSPRIDVRNHDGSLSFVLPSSTGSVRHRSRLLSPSSLAEQPSDDSALADLCVDMAKELLSGKTEDGWAGQGTGLLVGFDVPNAL